MQTYCLLSLVAELIDCLALLWEKRSCTAIAAFKNGKDHCYWSIAEKVRVARGGWVQRHILYLGEINDSQKEAWTKVINVFDTRGQQTAELALYPAERPIPAHAIGQSPDGNLPRANGHEFDVRLSTMAAMQEQPPPAGASLPPEPTGIMRLANGTIAWKRGGTAFDYFIRFIKPKTDQGGELIYWERPEGGRVFNAGSIGAGWALLADAKFQRLLSNVLNHFGVKR